MPKGFHGTVVASVGPSVIGRSLTGFVTFVAVDAALILARRECRADRPISLTGFIPMVSTMTTLDQPGVSKTFFVRA